MEGVTRKLRQWCLAAVSKLVLFASGGEQSKVAGVVVVSFKLHVSAGVVCNIVCASAKSNPQEIVL